MRKPLAILSAAVLALVALATVAIGLRSLRWQAGGPAHAPIVAYDQGAPSVSASGDSASGASANAGSASDSVRGAGGEETPSPADGADQIVTLAHSYSQDPATHEAAERLMAVDAEYVPEHVLASFSDGVTFDEASALLSQAASLDFSGLSQEEFDRGLAVLDVAAGCVVEDAVVELSEMGPVDIAQPDYVYHLAEEGAPRTAAALREHLYAGLGLATSTTGAPADAWLTLLAQASPVAINDLDGFSEDARIRRTWHLTDVNAFSAWSYLQDETGAIENDVCVAVIDDGFNASNADLQANCKVTYNATNSTSNVSETSGHGTHVAGIVAAEANNGRGTAGVSYNADLALIKVADDSGNMTTSYLYNAYEFVMGHKDEYNIRVANASLGTSIQKTDGTILNISDDIVYRQMKNVFEGGVVPVVASGNTGSDFVSSGSTFTRTPPYAEYPSDIPYSVSVINLEKGHQRSGRSNYNYSGSIFKNISAPGTDIYSTEGSSYGFKSGTSMASPLVAGVFSLAFSEKPSLTTAEARAIAYCTALDIAGAGWDEETGYGEIDALAMMECLNPTITGPTTLAHRQTAQLTLACGCDDASVAWSSSDPDAISVDESGVVECVGAGSAIVTATFTLRDQEGDTYVGTATHPIYANDVQYAEVSVPEQTYTGSALTPSPTVTFFGTPLVAGRDYTVDSYASNVNAGTATITIKGAGEFEGTHTASFTIRPASISGATVVAAATTYDYHLGYTTTTATVTLGGKALVQGTDYVLGDFSGNTNVGMGAGTATVTGIGNYAGSASGSFDIAPCDLTKAEDLEVTLTTPEGSSARTDPLAGVTLAGKALSEGTDFTTTHSHPSDTTGTCTITFRGRFTGARAVGYDRPPASIEGASVTGATQTYTGSPHTTTVTVTLGTWTLAEGRDFSVTSYDNNTGVGTATVAVAGIGDYSGTATGTFSVVARDVGAATVTAAAQTYTGASHEPAPTVTLDGVALTEGVDFSVTSYENNVNAGTATVKVTGRGNYSGTATGTFAIARADISNARVSAADQTHSGSALTPAPKVVLGGRTLAANRDYAVSYKNNVEAGTATVTATGRGNYAGTATGTFRISAPAPAPTPAPTPTPTPAPTPTPTPAPDPDEPEAGVAMQRLYNPNSGEHFYTASEFERDVLVATGWIYEGVGWTAPSEGEPVFRLYNAFSGDHHYTTSAGERDALVAVGWNYEGEGWRSGGDAALLRQYNPYATTGTHNYTTGTAERDMLVSIGWHDEGVGWYGLG